MREQTFRQHGGGIPVHRIPDWATHWREWYSPNGYSDAIQYTDDPAVVVTPASVGKPGAAMVSRWHERQGAK